MAPRGLIQTRVVEPGSVCVAFVNPLFIAIHGGGVDWARLEPFQGFIAAAQF
jgi:hypothetical protein